MRYHPCPHCVSTFCAGCRPSCSKCQHACPKDGPCDKCGHAPMEPGDTLCADCDSAARGEPQDFVKR
jgi:hypothetical protein